MYGSERANHLRTTWYNSPVTDEERGHLMEKFYGDKAPGQPVVSLTCEVNQCHILKGGVSVLSHMPEKYWHQRLATNQTVKRDESSPVPFKDISDTGEFMHAYFTHRNPAGFDNQPGVPRPKSLARRDGARLMNYWPDELLARG